MLDGSSLTANLCLVMAGIKLVDCCVFNLYTGSFDFKPVDVMDKNSIHYVPQSRKWNFPLNFCMGTKLATMYQEEFAYLFEIFDKASKEGQTIFPYWKRIEFANPANMAAIQKCLGIGEDEKVMGLFCH